ncbi:MAG: LysM peptidoglycan-binding domain-containing protein [Verrucomicrobia bacterium]|nr:LysM peptidoglycan-binding domain-containing protein [Verrucomicrobiota bacterium]
MKPTAILFALLATAGGARAEIELTGVLVDSGGLRLHLVDTTRGAKNWVRLGEIFAGHKVASFDDREGSAILTGDGHSIQLKLKTPKVQSDEPPEARKEYVIKAGDTIAKIARAHEITIAQLLEVNPGVNASKLKVGQTINLP